MNQQAQASQGGNYSEEKRSLNIKTINHMKVTSAQMILGLTVAAAAGAAIGMLLAPEKGTELQNRIREGTRTWLGELREIIGAGKELAEEKLRDTEAQLGDMKSNLSRIDQ
jgi:gas vesicle protein